MIVSNINVYDAKNQINLSCEIFKKNHKEISSYNLKDEINSINEKILDIWSVFYKKVSNNFEKNKSIEIINLSNDIQNAYLELEPILKSEKEYVNNDIESLFIQQNHNAEKIAKICVTKFLNLDDSNLKKELRITVSNFEKNIIFLLKSDLISEHVIDELKSNMSNWMSLKNLISKDSNDLDIEKILTTINVIIKK